MKKISRVSLGLVFVLCACHPGKPNNFDNLTTDVQGNFLNGQLVNAKGNPPYNTCPTTAGQIDNRLQVGMNFQTIFESVNGTSPKRQLTLNAQIQSVSSTALTESIAIANSVGLSRPSSSQGGSTNESLTCTTTGAKPGCVEPAIVNLMDPGTNGQYSTCYISPDKGQVTTPTAYSGKYRLADGTMINAYEIESEIKGTLICDGQTLGEGTQTTMNVVSMDVPAEGADSSCGGTKILSLDAYKNNDGRVVLGGLQERLTIPAQTDTTIDTF